MEFIVPKAQAQMLLERPCQEHNLFFISWMNEILKILSDLKPTQIMYKQVKQHNFQSIDPSANQICYIIVNSFYFGVFYL